MKKFLLFSASALMAMSAAAGLTDVTPKAYDFNSGLPVPYVNAYQDAEWGNKPWNPSAFFHRDHPELYKDGMVLMVGPQVASNFDGIVSGMNVVNLGGNVGNVLVINRPGSGIAAALKEATGYDYNIPEMTGTPGYIIPFWHSDPNLSGPVDGVDDCLRVRIVLNIYAPTLDLENSVFQPYMQTGSNGVPFDDNNSPRNVYSGDFALLWGEEEAEDGRIADFATASADDLDKYTDDDDNYVWNPNRWMVYEWDIPGYEEEEAPLKIKMEMPNVTSAVMIKSIQFLQKDADESSIERLTRRKSWQYLEYGSPASIDAVAADNNTLNVTVNGNAVSFGEAASVYTATGVLVATGAEVNLGNGLYIAVANGKTAKFVVK